MACRRIQVPASTLAQKLSRKAAYVSAEVAPQCLATTDTQIVLTCIGPISTVPLVFWLTWPSVPPSTDNRITTTAGGTRCTAAADSMQRTTGGSVGSAACPAAGHNATAVAS